MYKIKVFILIFGFGLFSKCSIIEETEITPILIGVGNLMGSENIAQQNLVVTNATQWQDLITQMDTYNPYSAAFSETNVDFDQFRVVAIFDQLYGNGGHGLEIHSIIENDIEIIVDYERLNPAGDATCVITQPFYIVKIPQSNKPVVFN